jgi:hypothetical protein
MSGLLFLSAFASSIVFSTTALAQFPMHDEARREYQQGIWQFDLQSTYYKATANYTRAGGQYNNLASGYGYQTLDFDFGTRWTPRKNWGIYASSRVANAESTDPLSTRRNSTFTQVVLGSDFVVYAKRNYQIAPDFSVTLPLERVQVQTDEVTNREGAIEISGQMVGRVTWGQWHPFTFAGFTWRDEDRSALVPFGLGVERDFQQWSLGAELRGYQTAIKDKYSNDPLKREALAVKNGTALRYYSVDPSLLETNFWMRKDLGESWDLKLGGGASITGQSTSAGWNLVAGITYFFNAAERTRTRRQDITVEETPSSFQEEINDGVDQNLFRLIPANPPAENPADQQKKKMQKDLDQTEFQIELKRPGKKKKKR